MGTTAAASPSEQEASAKDNAELEAITGDGEDSAPSVSLDGEEVEPGSDGLFDLASASNDVPMPLLVALIAIAVLAILGGLVMLRERVPALGRIPAPVQDSACFVPPIPALTSARPAGVRS